MTVVLGATWNPRGELPRLERFLPQIAQAYSGMVVVVGPETDQTILQTLHGFSVRRSPLSAVVVQDWSWGRYAALQEALVSRASHIHYADMDRLLRWVETRPEEWRRAVELIHAHDCLVFGRTEAATLSHPQALLRTEEISNLVASYLLGRSMDVSAGSKGFSRRATEFLVRNTQPGNALGTDAEWPVLLQRAGFEVGYMTVDGLDWEIPDQHQDEAAGPERQSRLAENYDADPRNWARRVEVALEIVRSGLDAARRDFRREDDV